jgi:hypothetical protein
VGAIGNIAIRASGSSHQRSVTATTPDATVPSTIASMTAAVRRLTGLAARRPIQTRWRGRPRVLRIRAAGGPRAGPDRADPAVASTDSRTSGQFEGRHSHRHWWPCRWWRDDDRIGGQSASSPSMSDADGAVRNSGNSVVGDATARRVAATDAALRLGLELDPGRPRAVSPPEGLESAEPPVVNRTGPRAVRPSRRTSRHPSVRPMRNSAARGLSTDRARPDRRTSFAGVTGAEISTSSGAPLCRDRHRDRIRSSGSGALDRS